jgi:UDP-N-acetylmuramate: L-alanyl-gamma-D-glutamyl-meso-diaminopimelate ligase
MNLEKYLTGNQIAERKEQIKRIFFYRICGTGMGAAATLLKEAGYDVAGADQKFAPPMSTYLKNTGIPLHQLSEIDSEFLNQFDLIVVGNVVPRQSDDAKLIESSGVSFCSFPAILGGLILRHQNVVGIAGTHGKTTTTYLAVQLFEKIGKTPGYFIGGVIEGRPSSRLGDQSYFFIESDEYDSGYFEKVSKFRLYELNHMILTSLEFDHGDIFENLGAIQQQFAPVVQSLKGSLIYDETYSGARECLQKYPPQFARRLESYGEGSLRGPVIIEMGPQGTLFELFYAGKKRSLRTNLVGRHNILNLSSILCFCDHEGISFSAIEGALTSFELVKRRQEVKGRIQGALVIDDFAHHPKAVKLTLEGLKIKYPDKKLVVVFEPHSATARSNHFQEEFEQAFEVCSELVLTTLHRPTSLVGAGDLNLAHIKSALEKKQIKATIVANFDELKKTLLDTADENSIIAVLSNGTCLGLWESELVQD